MFKNNIIIAWRNLAKHKTISFINIIGLAIGIAACITISLYVEHEMGYDQYNKNAENIVRVTSVIHAPESDIPIAPTPAPMADALQRDYPEVIAAVRFEDAPANIKFNNTVFREEQFYKTDQSIFSIFDFYFVEGDSATALTKPNTIVLTRSIARKYFGSATALGKTININNNEVLVTGVVEDRPLNSDIPLTAMLFADMSTSGQWSGLDVFTYVLLRKGTNLLQFKKKLDQLSKKYVQPELNKTGATEYSVEFLTEPLKDVHFSEGKLDDTPKGSRQLAYIFSALAIFILIIALLNYINLCTAKSSERAREVGIRKVSGALPFQLIRQFMFESFFTITIACIISVGLIALSIPYLHRSMNTALEINWQHTFRFAIMIFFITFLLAGLYPAFVLSNFKPIAVLKGRFHQSVKGVWFRKTITVTQFAIATVLVMGTTVVYHQMKFIEQNDLGFDKEHLLNINFPRDSALKSTIYAFRAKLLGRPEVGNVTVGSGLTESDIIVGTTIATVEGRKRELMCNYFNVDPMFLETFGLRLIEGRNISDSLSADKRGAYIANEALIKAMGWTSGLGQEIEGLSGKGHIIGVVKNFYYTSVHNVIEPILLTYRGEDMLPIAVSAKIKPSDLPFVQSLFKESFPSLVFDYAFFDDIINKKYQKDQLTMTLFANFTILAILVSSLGLYGLVSLMAVQRTKEIGVRKVLGATVSQLFTLMVKDFMILLSIALVIALPVAGIIMHEWLDTYAYHTTLRWWMYGVPVFILMITTLAVVSREIFRSAATNLVTNLRSE